MANKTRQNTQTWEQICEELHEAQEARYYWERKKMEAENTRPCGRGKYLEESKARVQRTIEEYTKYFEEAYARHLEAVATYQKALEERMATKETTEVVAEVAEESTEVAVVAEVAEATETTKTQETKTKKETKKSKTKTQNKEERKMETKKTTAGQRANRVVVRTESDGYTAEFYKTHKSIAVVHSGDTSWTANKEHNPTQRREDFRTWVQAHADEFGVAWIPELQQQAWDRKYWKYETDEQVEEDAIELMGWTIRSICEKVGLEVEIGNIVLDSIVPMDSPLSYVEHGRYTKNGNWAVAQVNLDVTATIEGTEINLIYPIEMRSGQLTKIKLTKQEIEMMVADSKIA